MMKVKVTGSFRVVGDAGWGVNFGPTSDVDALIPESDGMTLRDLRDAGQIPADCFSDEDDKAQPEVVLDVDDEQEKDN